MGGSRFPGCRLGRLRRVVGDGRVVYDGKGAFRDGYLLGIAWSSGDNIDGLGG